MQKVGSRLLFFVEKSKSESHFSDARIWKKDSQKAILKSGVE